MSIKDQVENCTVWNSAWNSGIRGCCVLWELEISEAEVKCGHLPNPAQFDSTRTLPLWSLPKTPQRATWLKSCLTLFAFLPTPWEAHSRRELPSESLNEKAPAFWPFSSETPCPHFQGLACHFGPLPLAPSLKLYKIVWGKLPLCHGPHRQEEEARIHTSLEAGRALFFFFSVCVFASLWFQASTFPSDMVSRKSAPSIHPVTVLLTALRHWMLPI